VVAEGIKNKFQQMAGKNSKREMRC